MSTLDRFEHVRASEDVPRTRIPAAGHAVRRKPIDAITEAVREHRRSLIFRPKSAGNDRQMQSIRAAPSSSTPTNEVKRTEHLPNFVRTMEYRNGVETFQFPTISPRVPRSATFPPPSPSLPEESSHIGVAIGSPTQASSEWTGSMTCVYVSPTISSPMFPEAPRRAPPPVPGSSSASAVPQRAKSLRWKVLGDIFRRPSKRVVNTAPIEQMPFEPAPIRPRSPPKLPTPAATKPVAPVAPPKTQGSGIRLFPNTTSNPTIHPHPAARRLMIEASRPSIDIAPPAHPRPSLHAVDKPLPYIAPLSIAKKPIVRPNQMRPDSPMDDYADVSQKLLPPSATPRLDLEIPNGDLERFSVMFAKLLGSESGPTLLERRQSKGQKVLSLRLDSKHDRLPSAEPKLPARINPGVLQRSQTAPHASNVPALSITTELGNSHDVAIFGSCSSARRTNYQTPTSDKGNSFWDGFVITKRALLVSESSPLSLDSSRRSGASSPITPALTWTSGSGFSPEEKLNPAVHLVAKGGIIADHSPSDSVDSDSVMESAARMRLARGVNVRVSGSSVAPSVSSAQSMRPRVVELSKHRKSMALVLETAT